AKLGCHSSSLSFAPGSWPCNADIIEPFRAGLTRQLSYQRPIWVQTGFHEVTGTKRQMGQAAPDPFLVSFTRDMITFSLRTIVSAPFDENTYIVWRPGRTDALVIDPGLEPDAILEEIKTNGLSVATILNTHGHADHIAGNETLKAAFP